MREPKIALVHDYLASYGGAEKTLEAILEVFPEAPIYTGIYKPKNLPRTITDRQIIHTKSPLLKYLTKSLTFLMPMVFESYDLSEYDVILSDSACWAKGVITKPNQLHISYIHTPPRFLYHYSVESPKRFKWYYRPIVSVVDHSLRIWDYVAGQRPDKLIANSETTRARIKKYYRRDADLIHPPVELPTQKIKKNTLQRPYFCALGRLAAYKNFDKLVEAFNFLGFELLIMGDGPERKRLERQAKPNIKFLGRVSDKQKYEVLANSLGLINPVQDEDWGIVPLEAMAVGKPVLAHRSGGARENITEGVTGAFFDSLELETLISAIRNFRKDIEAGKFNGKKIKTYVKQFSKERFKRELLQYIQKAWEEHQLTVKKQ